jgi:arylformamidase
MRQAYAWVVRNIAIYGGDACNICVCGSAGGHLAAMLLAKGGSKTMTCQRRQCLDRS